MPLRPDTVRTTYPDWSASEVGRQLLSMDWSATSLGPIDDWSPALRNVLSLMLHSRFPMCLAWGPEGTFIHNDAYMAMRGSPQGSAVGRPLREVWSEFWDDLRPQVEAAFAGCPSYYENRPITVKRNGQREQAYFTFSLSPVLDEGSVAGLFAVVTETTQQVLNDRRLSFLVELGDRLRQVSDPVEVGLVAARMIGEHCGASRAGYGEINHAQNTVFVERDWTHGDVTSLAGEARILDAFGPGLIDELRSGHTVVVEDFMTDARAGEAYAATWTSIGTRSVIVVPLIRDGRLRALFYLHGADPRCWKETETALARDVAERTWDAVERARAEAALRTSENRLRLAIDAGHMAVWEHDTATDTVTTSPELNRLLGYPPDAVLDLKELRARYYPGDRDRLTAAALDALYRGERFFEVEYRFYTVAGPLRWFLMRAEMILGPKGIPMKTIGVVLDITTQKETEDALRQRETELRDALKAGSLAIFDFDHQRGVMNPSERLSELYGYPPGHTLTLQDIRARYHPDDVGQIMAKRRSDEADTSVRFFEWTLRLLMPDGSLRWTNGRGEYIRDERGRILRSRGVVMDITDRKRWEEHQELLINELNHRVKNTLATVQSIAAQALRNSDNMQDARTAMESRLFALSRAHDVLTRENWEGAGLKEIVTRAMEPYSHEREARVHVEGSDVRLSPGIALALSMALQELATNAVKYGALSNDTGEVTIRWTLRPREGEPVLDFAWIETGGPPVHIPQRKGFGTRLIERSLAQDLNGCVKISFLPEGMTCTIEAPLT